MSYETLEEAIRKLWRSRGLEVVYEEVTSLEDGTMEWRIQAKEADKND